MTTTIQRLLLSFAVLTSSTTTTTTTHAAPGDLLWSDEFDAPGPPNPLHWDYDLGGGGWGNWEYQDYTSHPDNVAVEGDGALKIRAQRTSDTTFTSARLKTAGRLHFRYGTVEARIQVPDVRNGLWAAFWTLGETFPQVPWPACGELDVLEMGWSQALASGVGNRLVLSAVHRSGPNGHHRPSINHATPPYDLHQAYHLYRLEWTPDSIKMFVDEYEILSVTGIGAATCGSECDELHQPHYLIVNLAVGGGFTQQAADPNDGTRITAPFPATMAVDYVRIYDNGFTQLSGPAVDGGGGAPLGTGAPVAPPPPPTTAAPVTAAPVAAAPETPPPNTAPPPTPPPMKFDDVAVPPPPTAPPAATPAPVTPAPTTAAPATAAPTTPLPTTASPTTAAPTTPMPTTASPTTAAPSTRQPSDSPTVEPTTSDQQLRSSPSTTSSRPTAVPSAASGTSSGGGGSLTLPPTPADDAGPNPIRDDVSAAAGAARTRRLWTTLAAAAAAALPVL